ncbi:MAG: V-type ATP synthase subunit K [Oscillospiraceae bacterium]|jgi:V/A-type H+-transporting ATPase subunit K|nr:V-type ATP synthase subunit K [Oscillospiraceae bacterium]
MAVFFEQFGGLAIALLGAGLSVMFCCIGSAKGTGIAGEAAAGLIAENPEQFSKCLILQAIPGLQGLYGILIWFAAASKIGMFGAGLLPINLQQGWQIFAACLPIMFGGFLSAIFLGRVAAASINIVAKKPDDFVKGIILCVIVEFYGILSLLASLLMVNAITL